MEKGARRLLEQFNSRHTTLECNGDHRVSKLDRTLPAHWSCVALNPSGTAAPQKKLPLLHRASSPRWHVAT